MSPYNERLRALRHRFVALIAVSAMTLAIFVASAAPSRADSDTRKLMTFLFGAAALAILANELKDKDDDKPVVVTPEKPQGTLLPAACAIEVQVKDSKKAYTASCLRSYGYGRLPGHCAVSAQVYGQAEWLYPAKCMREAGYRTK